MSVDDVLQVDATVDSLLQLRKHPMCRISVLFLLCTGAYSLRGVGWIDNDSILGLVIGND